MELTQRNESVFFGTWGYSTSNANVDLELFYEFTDESVEDVEYHIGKVDDEIMIDDIRFNRSR